jgi:SagB-type dehydrogenase family enzyme
VANENVEVARGYHERTKHSEERLRASPHYLDWENQPIPFKLYRDLETIPLPRQLEPGTVSTLRAISALVGRESEPSEQVPGHGALARVLYYSAGITKVRRSPGGHVYFRAAPNTGALYHVDLYLACRDLPHLPAGIYHFGAHDFALRRLRVGDYRGALIEATGVEPSLAQAPAVVASASTYWRNAWKYRERAYRHAFWDGGTLHANLLAVAAARGLAAKVVAGFADRDVEHLLGLDPAREGALALVPLGRTAEPPPPAPDAPVLNLETEPLSSRETDYPAIRAIHSASSLEHGEEVARWGRLVLPRPEPDPRSELFPLRPLAEADWPAEPLESVILRRGSTRRFDVSRSLTFEELSTALAVATATIPASGDRGPTRPLPRASGRCGGERLLPRASRADPRPIR